MGEIRVFDEQWKEIQFDPIYQRENVLEISNFGRIRSFNRQSNGKLVKGSITNGYKIIRLKLYKPISAAVKAAFEVEEARIKGFAAHLNQLRRQINGKENLVVYAMDARQLEEGMRELAQLKVRLAKWRANELKTRTDYYHALFHRLVAQYFLPPPLPGQEFVAHLDYNKHNNAVHNLKWMTLAENIAHQQLSPYVIEEKKHRNGRIRRADSKVTKLTVTKVMLLKKLLAQKVPMKRLVSQFKITETQIIRIRKGENWGDITLAEDVALK